MTEFFHPHDAPREVDCDCGERHIVDPAAAERTLAGRTFVCVQCKQKFRTDLVGAFAMDGHGSSGAVCLRCCVNHLHILIQELSQP